MIRFHKSLQTDTCAKPKAKLNPKICIRAGGRYQKNCLVSPLLCGGYTDTLPTPPCLSRSTAEQLRAHRLLRRINPGWAPPWLQNHSWAFTMWEAWCRTSSRQYLIASSQEASEGHWFLPWTFPLPERINGFYPCVPKALSKFTTL